MSLHDTLRNPINVCCSNHPSDSVFRSATANAEHLRDNLDAALDPLPDPDMRDQIARAAGAR